jgi:TonB-linked SusC/RagA family outer membrane protein
MKRENETAFIKLFYLKELRMMKLTFVFVLLACLQSAARTYSQDKITVNLQSTELKKALNIIERKTSYHFLYNESLFANKPKVDLSVKDADINTVLEKILKNNGISYRILNNNLIVLKAEGSNEAQDIRVTGKVTGVNAAPLQGVSITIRGTNTGTATDENGNFSITVPEENSVLVFSYVGYATQEVTVGNRTSISVSMQSSASQMDNIVVVGYGTKRKVDVTGSIGQIKGDEIAKQASINPISALQGKLAGVQITNNGAPGASPQIRIRGVGSVYGNPNPLYVVDGVPTLNVADINPNDIESMQVLKDAGSASIYGSRAANGVIVISTKKGKDKVKVQYDAYYGTQRPKTGNVWNILSPQEMANLKRLAEANTGETEFDDPLYGNGPTYVLPDYIYPLGAKEGDPSVNPSLYNVKPLFTSDEEYNNFYRINRANKAGTNWYDEIFNPAPITSQNISVSGGSDQGSYLFSANYFNQKGTLDRTYLKRYTVRSNTQYNIGKYVRVGENLAYTITNNPKIDGLSGDNAIGHAFREQPIIPVYDIMGNFAGGYGGKLGDAYNPVAMLYRTKDNKATDNRLFGNIFAEADILPFLTLRTAFGADSFSGASRSFVFPQYENAENTTSNSYAESSNTGLEYTWTNTLSFNKTFNLHSLKVLVGTEYNKNRYSTMSGSNKGYFSFDPDYTNLSNGSGPMETVSERTADALFSLIGRVDYAFNDKYLIGATIRRDGSSKFLKNTYGVFPAVSGAWRISKESFLSDVKWITDLKIRGGWGIMGNQVNVSGANSFTTFGSSIGQSYYAIGGGNAVVAGFFQNQTGNPDAKWEKNVNSNFGFDATLFGGGIEISADYYQKNVRDLLYNPEMIGTVGAATVPFVNIAQMKNDGFDISLTGHKDVGSDLKLNATATITTYRNEIKKVSGDVDYYDVDSRRFDGSRIIRNAVGHSVSEFFGYKIAGFWNSDNEIEAANTKAQAVTGDPNTVYQDDVKVGRFKYADVNGDGMITADDRTFLGNANPDFSYGLNLGASFKNFDFSAFFYGVQGNSIWNQVKWWTDFVPSFGGAKSHTALYDSWTPSHQNAKAPIQETTQSFSTNSVPNSYFVEKGSYLRLKNVQIGYTLAANKLQKLGVNRLRVYISAANLFTVTKYSGVDPEVGTSSETGQQTAYGVDDGSYPSQRTFLLGLNLQF